MAQIEGVSVSDRDGWWLVERLRAAGRVEDVTAAYAIQVAIESGEGIGCLTPAEKGAVLHASTDHPVTLTDLCNQLAHDLLDRGLLDRD